ncbi:hypothetical protein GOP47_0028114 [Adiantum capillus-veneris]|nr:hypothetical protein GOP47_0028114 [Adiantum capillus-veneris]
MPLEDRLPKMLRRSTGAKRGCLTQEGPTLRLGKLESFHSIWEIQVEAVESMPDADSDKLDHDVCMNMDFSSFMVRPLACHLKASRGDQSPVVVTTKSQEKRSTSAICLESMATRRKVHHLVGCMGRTEGAKRGRSATKDLRGAGLCRSKGTRPPGHETEEVAQLREKSGCCKETRYAGGKVSQGESNWKEGLKRPRAREDEEEPPEGWSSSENTQGRSRSEAAIAKEEIRELKERGRYGLVK